MYLLLGLSSLLVKIAALFEKFLLDRRTLEKLTKNILPDCFGIKFVPLHSQKKKLLKWPKSRENRTNVDIILLFLAKPLDKHDITLVHITYPPLVHLI